MTVTLKKLLDLVGKDILVVQIDGKAFKGRLVEIDDQVIHISNALEFSPGDKRWKISMISVPPESSVEGDQVKHDKLETIKLRDIIISFAGIIRIYPLSTKSVAPEKPIVEKPAKPFVKPVAESPKSTGGYVIRSISPSDEKKKW